MIKPASQLTKLANASNNVNKGITKVFKETESVYNKHKQNGGDLALLDAALQANNVLARNNAIADADKFGAKRVEMMKKRDQLKALKDKAEATAIMI